MTQQTVALTTGAVLQEAARLFAERGYSNTRMQDIAKRFGVTHAALYYHFRNKQDILLQLNRTALDGLLDTIGRITASATIPEDEKFEHAVHGHVSFVAQNVLVVATLFDHEYALPTAYLRRLRKTRREYTDTLVRLFEAAQAAGRFVDIDPRLAVYLLLGAGTWMYRWYHEEGEWTPESVADQALELLAHGYRRHGVALSTAVAASVDGSQQ